MITVMTMFRGEDAEIFVQVVEGRLTPEQRAAWRAAHQCDVEEDGDGDSNNMFFREFERPLPNCGLADMYNADDHN